MLEVKSVTDLSSLKKKKSLRKNKTEKNFGDEHLLNEPSILKRSNSSPVNCECEIHTGKMYLNQKFDLSVDYLYDCLIGHNEMYMKFSKTRNISGMKTGEWEADFFNGSKIKSRRLEYSVGLNWKLFNGIQSCKNTDVEKLIKYVPSEMYIVETESSTHGVPYSDRFKIITKFCLTKCSLNSCNLLVHSSLVYSNKPNILIKGIIDKSCERELTDYFKELEKNLNKESIALSSPRLNIESLIESNASSSNRSSIRSTSSSMNSSFDSNEFTPESDGSSKEIKSVDSLSTINNRKYVKKPLNESLYGGPFELNLNRKAKLSVSEAPFEINPDYDVKKSKIRDIPILKDAAHSRREVKFESTSSPNTICSCCQANNSKFYFYIDAQTFLRLFFLIMFILVGLNFMLYFKLNHLEQIANNIQAQQKLKKQ